MGWFSPSGPLASSSQQPQRSVAARIPRPRHPGFLRPCPRPRGTGRRRWKKVTRAPDRSSSVLAMLTGQGPSPRSPAARAPGCAPRRLRNGSPRPAEQILRETLPVIGDADADQGPSAPAALDPDARLGEIDGVLHEIAQAVDTPRACARSRAGPRDRPDSVDEIIQHLDSAAGVRLGGVPSRHDGAKGRVSACDRSSFPARPIERRMSRQRSAWFADQPARRRQGFSGWPSSSSTKFGRDQLDGGQRCAEFMGGGGGRPAEVGHFLLARQRQFGVASNAWLSSWFPKVKCVGRKAEEEDDPDGDRAPEADDERMSGQLQKLARPRR